MRYQFVDCRWELGNQARGLELYQEGHIPGASFLDVDRDLSAAPGERGRHPLPAQDEFAAAAGRAGIGAGVFVVAYGSTGGAERLWWLLRHFGHDDCAVIDLDGWRGPLRAGEEEIEPARFEPRPRDDDTIEADELAARLDDPGLLVLDARVPERFRGEPNPIDRVPGRVPGACNAPFTGALPDGVLEAPEIAVYCGSGVTACVQLLALSELGRPDAKLYPGSWSEWEQLALPVETG
jgi:thiosulfate/3-mercaptopyruvate sulfurtransferase